MASADDISTPPAKQRTSWKKHFPLARLDRSEPFTTPYTQHLHPHYSPGWYRKGWSEPHNGLTEIRKGEFLATAYPCVTTSRLAGDADVHHPQVSANDEEGCQDTPQRYSTTETIPSSPPPSFRSRASSPSSRHLLSEDPITTEAERTLADTFDDGSDSDDDGHNEGDDRQRLMRANTHQSDSEQRTVNDGNGPNLPEAVTRLPVVAPPLSSNVPARPYTGASPFSTYSHSNDGVFANLDAKPERGEKLEEQPPVSTFIAIHLRWICANTVLVLRGRRCGRHTPLLGNHRSSTWPPYIERRSIRRRPSGRLPFQLCMECYDQHVF